MEKIVYAIDKAGLSRIFQHFTEPCRSFGVVSAFKGIEWYKNKYPKKKWTPEKVQDENQKRHIDLIKLVHRAGFGFFVVVGHYIGETGEEVQELSVFIPVKAEDSNRLYKLLLKWGKKFDQDAILFRAPDKKEVLLVDVKTERVLMKLRKFTVQNLSSLYSSIKGRKFSFEGVEIRDSYFKALRFDVLNQYGSLDEYLNKIEGE